MYQILSKKTEGDQIITKYLNVKSGKEHIVKTVKQEKVTTDVEEISPSIHEKILIENQYQTALIEMQTMGGM